MNEKYKKRRNNSFKIFLGGLVLLYALVIIDPSFDFVSAIPSVLINIFVLIFIILELIWAASYFYGCYTWGKAKGYGWSVGIGLSLLSFIGVIILFALNDKSLQNPSSVSKSVGD